MGILIPGLTVEFQKITNYLVPLISNTFKENQFGKFFLILISNFLKR